MNTVLSIAMLREDYESGRLSKRQKIADRKQKDRGNVSGGKRRGGQRDCAGKVTEKGNESDGKKKGGLRDFAGKTTERERT